MIPKQKIEKGQYWDDSLTLMSGCSRESEGCEHCWAAAMASRFPWGKGFAENGKWTGKIEPNYKALEKLERRIGSERKLKSKVFCIWNDFFHPQMQYAFKFQLRALHAMYYLEDDIFLVLTKRPENIENSAFCQGPFEDTDLSNVYIGVSVESQKHIHRIDQLIQNWPGKKFVSIEPSLGAVYLSSDQLAALDQVIIGCESGLDRREPPDNPILREMIRQCETECVPVFLKQWIDRQGKLVKMPTMFGRKWDQLVWNAEKGDKG